MNCLTSKETKKDKQELFQKKFTSEKLYVPIVYSNV